MALLAGFAIVGTFFAGVFVGIGIVERVAAPWMKRMLAVLRSIHDALPPEAVELRRTIDAAMKGPSKS